MRIKLGNLTYLLYEETQTAAVVGCPDYVSTVSIPNTVTFDGLNYTVTKIGEGAFGRCKSLKSVMLPDSVTSIGDSAFGACKSLESITIPDSVVKIGDCAFYNCHNLKSITIPDSVTSIWDHAFDRCESLTEICIPGTEKAFPLWVSLMDSEYADLVRQV